MKNLRIGGTGVNGYIKEQVAIGLLKAHEGWHSAWIDDALVTSEVVSGLHAKIKELEEDIRFKDRLLSEMQSPAKWYANIPEQGVLCWCEGEHEGEGFKDDIPCKRILARIDSYTPKPTAPRKDSFTANWGFLNREHWVWYENVQPLTNEEIEEFKR